MESWWLLQDKPCVGKINNIFLLELRQDVWSYIRTLQLSNFRDLLRETLSRTAGDQQKCLQRSQLGFMSLPVGIWLTSSVPSFCAGAAPPVHMVIFMLFLLLEVQEQQQVPCPRLSHKMQLRTRQNRRAGTKGCTQDQLCVQNNCALPLLQHLSTHLGWNSLGCRWTGTADEKLNGLCSCLGAILISS